MNGAVWTSLLCSILPKVYVFTRYGHYYIEMARMGMPSLVRIPYFSVVLISNLLLINETMSRIILFVERRTPACRKCVHSVKVDCFSRIVVHDSVNYCT